MIKNAGLALLILFLSSFFMIPVLADNGGYTVEPAVPWENLTPEQQAHADYSGADATVSFWQLPLWIQLSYISGALGAAAGSVILLPMVVRKLRSSYENRYRNDIFKYVQNNPGCTATEISKNQGINMGTARYHIRMLQSSCKIVIKRFGKFIRLYKNSSTYSDRQKVIFSHLRNETRAKLLTAVMEKPGITSNSLADMFGLEKSTTYSHMRKLARDHMVTIECNGGSRSYFLSTDVKDAMLLKYECP